jgi:hypothetical protein
VEPDAAIVILLGAGAGRRLGGAEPKALLPIGGRPILAVAAAAAAGAFAFAPVGPPGGVRVSVTGSEGETDPFGADAAVAYNSRRREYLVVWEAEGFATAEKREVFGRRLSRAGRPVGSQFRISTTGGDADDTRNAQDAAVAYNAKRNQYLIVWVADGLATDDELEIFGQRLGPTGAKLGGRIRISTTGTDGDDARDATDPAVAYDSRSNRYLVVWRADGLATDDEFEIFGQRLGTAGAQLGGDFRISTTGTDGDATRDASEVGVAFNPALGQYLAVWRADGLATNNENKIFGQRLGSGGAELGGDVRISTTGADGDTRDAFDPELAADAKRGHYLVAWEADGLAADNDFEIFGQRLRGSAAKLGGRLRISITGAPGDADRASFDPVVAYSPRAKEYIITWSGDGLATDEEFEIFGQRVAARGRRLDPNFRISRIGTDGDDLRSAFDPAIAFGPTSTLSPGRATAWTPMRTTRSSPDGSAPRAAPASPPPGSSPRATT